MKKTGSPKLLFKNLDFTPIHTALWKNLHTKGPGRPLNTTPNGTSKPSCSAARAGDSFAYSVAAVDVEGRYDIYTMNSDGTQIRDLTSQIFPQSFLAHKSVFSDDNSTIYFIGEL